MQVLASGAKSKVVAVVEARMGSSRLPGKVLMPAAGRPMLGHLIDRLRSVDSLDEIIIATTVNSGDDEIATFCAAESVHCFRGSGEDVLERVLGAAASVEATDIVNITGDCPLIDPGIAEQVIRMHFVNSAQYTSNSHFRSYPDGMDVQVCARTALEDSASRTRDRLDREHVTLFIRNHPEIYRHLHLVAPPELHWPELGITLDEPADLVLIRHLIHRLGADDPLFGCDRTIAYLREHPAVLGINSHVQRKGDT